MLVCRSATRCSGRQQVIVPQLGLEPHSMLQLLFLIADRVVLSCRCPTGWTEANLPTTKLQLKQRSQSLGLLRSAEACFTVTAVPSSLGLAS